MQQSFRFSLYFLSLYVIIWLFSDTRPSGDYSNEAHLFPFRTEKLSSLAQMVLPLPVEEYVVARFF